MDYKMEIEKPGPYRVVSYGDGFCAHGSIHKIVGNNQNHILAVGMKEEDANTVVSILNGYYSSLK